MFASLSVQFLYIPPLCLLVPPASLSLHIFPIDLCTSPSFIASSLPFAFSNPSASSLRLPHRCRFIFLSFISSFPSPFVSSSASRVSPYPFRLSLHMANPSLQTPTFCLHIFPLCHLIFLLSVSSWQSPSASSSPNLMTLLIPRFRLFISLPSVSSSPSPVSSSPSRVS